MRSVTTVNLVVKRGERFLLVKRAKNDDAGDMWSIAGGTLDGDESPQEGLKREIKEELNCDVTRCERFCVMETLHKDKNLKAHSIYFTGEIDGDIELNEDELTDFGWFTKDEIKDLSVAFNQKDVLKKFT